VTIGGGVQTDAAINPGNRFVAMAWNDLYTNYLLQTTIAI
jgi:hypothetical protein